jgi:hypothetical protein
MFEAGENELCHTGKDIGETNNIAAAHPEIVKDLEASCRRWMDDTEVPRMAPNPEYDATTQRKKRRTGKEDGD